jgi:CMP-N-acetylneuraminic acid synthetase
MRFLMLGRAKVPQRFAMGIPRMTEILGIIPARGGSKGIKDKNIMSLGGRPLIEYTFAAAGKSAVLSRVILTTDSPAIAKLGTDAGIEVPFLRPEELARDESPSRDFITHCLDFLRENGRYMPEVCVLLQPTSPFRNHSDIDECCELLMGSDADSVISISKLAGKYYPGWQMVKDKTGHLEPFGGGGWDGLIPRRQDLPETYIRNGAVYVFRVKSFHKYGNIYGKKVLGYEMPEERSLNIDGMRDFRQAQALMVEKWDKASRGQT